MIAMLTLYVIAGAHAGWFMGEIVNMKWRSDNLEQFNNRAFDPIRRFVHHWLSLPGFPIWLWYFAHPDPSLRLDFLGCRREKPGHGG